LLLNPPDFFDKGDDVISQKNGLLQGRKMTSARLDLIGDDIAIATAKESIIKA